MTPTTLQHLTIGAPVTTLPDRRNTSGQGEHWRNIAAAAKDATGAWVPVRFPKAQRKGLSARVTDIKNGKYVAFRDGTYDAAQREGVLYVRHISDVATLPKIRRTA